MYGNVRDWFNELLFLCYDIFRVVICFNCEPYTGSGCCCCDRKTSFCASHRDLHPLGVSPARFVASFGHGGVRA